MTRPPCKDYLVAILDIQGQSDLLGDWRETWRSSSNPEIDEHVDRTWGRVQSVRKVYQFFADELATSRVRINEAIKELPSYFSGSVSGDPFVMFSFSDATVFAARLDFTDDGIPQLLGIFELLLAIGQTFVFVLANGVAIRGGIELGPSLPIGEREIYGPALHDAHRLESQCAGHPRILVGPSFIEFVNKISSIEPHSKEAQVAQAMAKKVKAFLLPATSMNEKCKGVEIHELDCFGIARFFHPDGQAAEVLRLTIDRCRAFAEQERNAYSSKGNQKVADKYALLLKAIS